jgi:Co/Zn/Cd efflux system component
LATKFIYADPIVSTFVGIMIISTAIPLSWRSGQFLMNGAPRNIDTLGVREDIERITGKNTVHELHIWNISTWFCEGISFYLHRSQLIVSYLQHKTSQLHHCM